MFLKVVTYRTVFNAQGSNIVSVSDQYPFYTDPESCFSI
jgi:hypothetical protein